MKDKIYVVEIITGYSDDIVHTKVFATMDEEKANNWVNRFNKIIRDNSDRIEAAYLDADYDNPLPFWYTFITWDSPFAVAKEVEIR